MRHLPFPVVLLPVLLASVAAPALAAPAPGASVKLVPALIRGAMAAADQVTDPAAKARALAAVGAARAQAGNADGAKQSFAAAEQAAQAAAKPEDRVAAQGGIAAWRAQAGDAAAAQAAFEAARQAALTIQDIPTRVGKLCDISADMMQAGDMAGARQMIKAAQEAAAQFSFGGDTNVRYWHDRMNGMAIVRALARAGDMAQARSVTDGIADGYMKSSGFWGISSAQVKAKDFAAAQATIGRMTDKDIRALALAELAQAQGAGADQSVEALSAGAVARAKSGDVTAARQAAEGMTDPYWKAVTLSQIVGAIMKAAH